MLSLNILDIHEATGPSLYARLSYQMGAQPSMDQKRATPLHEALVSLSCRYSRDSIKTIPVLLAPIEGPDRGISSRTHATCMEIKPY